MARTGWTDFYSKALWARRALFLASSTMLGGVAIGTGSAMAAPTVLVATKSFQISPQPLANALTTFGIQSGWQISVPDTLTAKINSPGVVGNFAPDIALSHVLAGTGLTYQISGSHSVIIKKASANITLGPVRVGGAFNAHQAAIGPGNGYVATYTDAGTKTDTPLWEIPNSIYIITKQQMLDQQSQTVQEVLRYMPGIYSESLGTASWGSGSTNSQGGGNFTQRGFKSTQYVDGILSNSEGAAEPAFLERVEAVNGPASVMYGQSGPGGLLAMTLKQPTETPLHNATLGFGNWGRYEATLDISDNITKSGNLKYRIAAIGVTQGSQTDYVDYHRVGVLPSIKWDIDNKTSLTLLGMYMYTPGDGSGNYYPEFGTLIPGKYGYIPRSRFFGDPAYNLSGNREARFEYQFSHKFNKNLEFRQNLMYQDSQRFFNNTYGAGLASDGETYSTFGWRGNLGGNTSQIVKTVGLDSRLIGHLNTGPVTQTLVAGVDYRHVDQEWGLTYDFTAHPINIWNPVITQHPNYATENIHSYYYPTTWNQTGVYFQDQIKFEKLTVTLGGREDWFDLNNQTYGGTGLSATKKTAETKGSSTAFTWRAGFTYNFDFGLTPYFSFSKSFTPQFGSILVGGMAAPPLTGNQFEAGLKYLIPHTDIFLTAAAYHIRENNVLEPSPEVMGQQIDGGTVTSKGVELSAHANITKDLRLTASYSYDDIRYSNSTKTVMQYDIYGNPLQKVSLQGKYFTATPRNMVNMFFDYTLPRRIFHGLGVNFGVRYIGFTYAGDANSFKVPAYTLFDVGAHYDFSNISRSLSGLKASLAMSNIANKRFVGSCAVGQCYYGQAQRIYGNISYSW